LRNQELVAAKVAAVRPLHRLHHILQRQRHRSNPPNRLGKTYSVNLQGL
jgi:hypothetical protein